MAHTYFSRILILPDAGPKNPFQYLMVGFLRKNGLNAFAAPKLKLFSLYTAIKKTNPDVVYFDWIHSFILGKSLAATLMKSITFVLEIMYAYHIKSISMVHTVHNIQNHKGIKVKFEKFVYRFFLLKCSRVRVYSLAVKNEIIAKFKILPERIFVIQDIPFHHYYPNDSTKPESRLRLGLESGDFVYLFFGRIEPYKGIQNLIEAFIKIAQDNDRLVIAGESLDEEYLLKLKNLTYLYPNIIWYNQFIDKNSVQYFFNAADIVVFPFTKIDHSGSVDLSLSFAKPVITLATEASSSLLAHQHFFLFRHPSKLADLMRKAKNSDLDIIGKQNFKIADSANYSDLLTLFKRANIRENENTFRHEHI